MKTVAELEPMVCVGVDWASEEHAVCVVGGDGRKSSSFNVAHSRDGFEKLVKKLAAFGPAGQVPVAIERPDGRLVDVLLGSGFPVVPVSPNAIKAWRDSEVVSGAKDDPGDAEVIAEYLRLRSHKLTVLAPFSEQTRALRAVVRARDDLVEQRVAAHNQLEACLDAFWPGAKVVFADICSDIALTFLGRYPTPPSARALGEKRMQAFLAKHRYTGRRTAAELLERLRAAPEGIARWPRGRSPRGRGARLRAGHPGPQRLGQSPRSLDRRPPGRAPGRRDLHVAATLRSGQRGPDARPVGRLPSSLRLSRSCLLPCWGCARHQEVRQVRSSPLPLGLRQTLPPGHDHLR